MENSSLESQIYNARKNLLTQLKTQKYKTDDYEGFSMTEINTMIKYNQLDFVVENENKNKTYVKFYINKILRPNNINTMVELHYHLEKQLNKNDTLYIISNSDPNESLVKLLNNYWQRNGIFIIINSLQRLQFNILEHSLVPNHVILSKEEEEKFRKEYNIKNNSQIPSISRYDPVAVAISMRPGEVCKISRPSRTAITTDYYRVCVI